MSLPVLVIAGLLTVWLLDNLRCLRRNINVAKQTGLPYIVVPIYWLNPIWALQSWFWLPLIFKLPRSWIFPWAYFLGGEWPYLLKNEPYEYCGSSIFLIVAPGKILCSVADADAIVQIATRRNDFPKPVEFYQGVDIYGKSVLSTEGQVWRHHRKITSPPFTEKNNLMVWHETLHQTRAMIEGWIGEVETTSKPTVTVAAATMQLSLHVISRAGFGVRLLWPHEERASKGEMGQPPKGHTMTYKEALVHLLENLISVVLLPKWLMKHSPFKSNRETHIAVGEWEKYMREMYDEKKAQLASGQPTDDMDLMGALIRGAGGDESSKTTGTAGQLFTEEEILGNAFVFILAGHETAGNTLHLSILQLAMNPSIQRHLQRDLDAILGTRPASEWSYEDDLPKLANSMAGAVMAEELRLWPPAPAIPKSVAKSSTPQGLSLPDRRNITIFPGTILNINCIATHLDPTAFPITPGADPKQDILVFRPERWLPDFPGRARAGDEADKGGLFHPRRGAYIPFSEGARSCLGRRFAQVEILAVLATVFRDYSVELAVEEMLYGAGWPYAPGRGDEVPELPPLGGDKEGQWRRARERAEQLFRDKMGTIITMQMRGARIPVRFVRRGHERFPY